MDRTFYDPIRIPPLSQSLSVLAKLIFHYLGHVFWFSGIVLLIMMAVNGVVPVTDNLFDGSLAFRSMFPPFTPVDVPIIVNEAALGLIRLMAVSMAGAFVVLLAGGMTLQILSVIASILSLPIAVIKWASETHAEQPIAKPAGTVPERKRPNWGTALADERANQQHPDLTKLARAAGAWTGRALQRARKLGRSVGTMAAKIIHAAPLPPHQSTKTPPSANNDRQGMWSEIRNALRGPEPPNQSKARNTARRLTSATG